MMKGYEMMLITTTNILEGFRIKEYKGIVRGIIVRSPTISESFFAGLKSVVGGKMGALTNMCEKARHQAFEEMVSEAVKLGANAIIGIDYDSSDISFKGEAATEIICYGTAVLIERS